MGLGRESLWLTVMAENPQTLHAQHTLVLILHHSDSCLIM